MDIIPPSAATEHFDRLTVAEKAEAICQLADQGFGDYDIAAATKLSVEMVRTVLAERAAR